MTDDQVAALMADLTALKWAAAVIAKTLTLLLGVFFWQECRRWWTSGSELF